MDDEAIPRQMGVFDVGALWSAKSISREDANGKSRDIGSSGVMDASWKKLIEVKFEKSYLNMSGIQVRYLKITKKSGYQALSWVICYSKWGVSTENGVAGGKSRPIVAGRMNGDWYGMKNVVL